jgi:hypothetical protein
VISVARVGPIGSAADDDSLSGAISQLADVPSIRLLFFSQALF